MVIAWDITSKCNLSCIHCYNSRNYNNVIKNKWVKGDLTTIEIESILHKLKGHQIELIQFLGGEPFVRADFLKILQCAKDNGIRCNIATNGIPLNDKRIAMLADLSPNQIAFSIDGGSAATNDYLRGSGSFNKAMINLRKLSGYFHQHNVKTRLGIQCTLYKNNFKEISKIIDMAKIINLHFVGFDTLKIMSSDQPHKTKLSGLVLGYVDRFQCTENIAKIMANESNIDISILNFASPKVRSYLNDKYGIYLKVSKGCTAVSGMMYIRADGNVFPCNYDSDFPYDIMSEVVKKQALDFKELSFNEVVDSDYFKSFYYFANSGDVYQQLKYCKKCSLYDVCNPCSLDVFRSGEKVCKECMEFDKYITNRGKKPQSINDVPQEET